MSDQTHDAKVAWQHVVDAVAKGARGVGTLKPAGFRALCDLGLLEEDAGQDDAANFTITEHGRLAAEYENLMDAFDQGNPSSPTIASAVHHLMTRIGHPVRRPY